MKIVNIWRFVFYLSDRCNGNSFLLYGGKCWPFTWVFIPTLKSSKEKKKEGQIDTEN